MEGAGYILQAMKRNGVRRYIGHGTPSVLDPREKPAQTRLVGFMGRTLLPRAYRELLGMTDLIRNADVDCTIVRFTAPKNTPKTGKVRAGFYGTDRIGFAISWRHRCLHRRAVDDSTYINAAPAISN